MDQTEDVIYRALQRANPAAAQEFKKNCEKIDALSTEVDNLLELLRSGKISYDEALTEAAGIFHRAEQLRQEILGGAEQELTDSEALKRLHAENLLTWGLES